MEADNHAHHGGSRLRIAMVAPPWFELPPDGYERIYRRLAAAGTG